MVPARAPAPTWINSNANDTWWWVTTNCGSILARRMQVQQVTAEPAYFGLNGAILHSQPAGMTYLERDALGVIHLRKSLR